MSSATFFVVVSLGPNDTRSHARLLVLKTNRDTGTVVRTRYKFTTYSYSYSGLKSTIYSIRAFDHVAKVRF